MKEFHDLLGGLGLHFGETRHRRTLSSEHGHAAREGARGCRLRFDKIVTIYIGNTSKSQYLNSFDIGTGNASW